MSASSRYFAFFSIEGIFHASLASVAFPAQGLKVTVTAIAAVGNGNDVIYLQNRTILRRTAAHAASSAISLDDSESNCRCYLRPLRFAPPCFCCI